jgi:16S rRNA (guanine(966)-N(2))-methyltransferase RsmD
MRVIAGKARRTQLKSIEGMATRPTTDRIKETLFNMLAQDIYGSHFLDLFSGSGAIGIEALSRGAELAVFVENNRQAARCIEENLAKTKLASQAVLWTTDCASAIQRLDMGKQHFDIIFMDPPYNKLLEKEMLGLLRKVSFIDEETLIIIEASLETDFNYLEAYGYCLTKQKKYKTNQHVFVKRVLENKNENSNLSGQF